MPFDAVAYALAKRALNRLITHEDKVPLSHPDKSVTTEKIADGAVTDAKISGVSRDKIIDLFSEPFWDNIPDKPFETLGSEFSVSNGELQISSIDFSKIVNRLSSLMTFDSSLVPNADDAYDLGSPSARWKGVHAKDYIIYTNAHFEHDKTDRLLSLLTKDALHDILLFRPPDVYEYNDGEGWVTGTVDDNVKSLFIGKRGYFEIPNGRVGVRFTWNGTIPPYTHYEIFFMKFISKASGLRVVIEVSSDGSTWETILDEATDNWCNNFVARLDFNVSNDKRHLRITLYPTWKSKEPPIKLYTIKLFNYNEYAWKPDLSQLFDWDVNKVISFYNTIRPATDNTYDLGSETARWRNAYIVNLYAGDVIFHNDWVITEYDENGHLMNGLRILNDRGEEILRITEDGLYFKGQKLA